MDLPDQLHTSESRDEFPNNNCRAVQIPAIANFAYCVSETPNVCPHSLYFGRMYLCRHASCQAIVARTESQSI
jgi:hypothetical protein